MLQDQVVCENDGLDDDIDEVCGSRKEWDAFRCAAPSQGQGWLGT